MGFHMYFVPQPSSLYSDDPWDCIVLSSSILNSTPIVKEDQAIDGFGVAQPTYVVIHEEYEWELEHQSLAKDDFLLSEPPPCFLDIFGDSAIFDFPCINPSIDVSIVDHSKNISDVSP